MYNDIYMNTMSAATLMTRLQHDMRQALKDRNRLDLEELRSLLARISSAEAIAPSDDGVQNETPIAGAVVGVGNSEAARKLLTLDDLLAVLQAEHDEIMLTISQVGPDTAYGKDLQAKATVVERYLQLGRAA